MTFLLLPDEDVFLRCEFIVEGQFPRSIFPQTISRACTEAQRSEVGPGKFEPGCGNMTCPANLNRSAFEKPPEPL